MTGSMKRASASKAFLRNSEPLSYARTGRCRGGRWSYQLSIAYKRNLPGQRSSILKILPSRWRVKLWWKLPRSERVMSLLKDAL